MAKKVKRFKAKKGSHLTNAQAQIVGQHIEKIMTQNGGEIDPLTILCDAENPKSPLHQFFEWNNSEAADQWRLQQARTLVASVVEVVVIAGKQQEYRSFYSVTNKQKERVYVTIETVKKTPSYVNQLLTDAYSYIENLQRVILLLKEEIK